MNKAKKQNNNNKNTHTRTRRTKTHLESLKVVCILAQFRFKNYLSILDQKPWAFLCCLQWEPLMIAMGEICFVSTLTFFPFLFSPSLFSHLPFSCGSPMALPFTCPQILLSHFCLSCIFCRCTCLYWLSAFVCFFLSVPCIHALIEYGTGSFSEYNLVSHMLGSSLLIVSLNTWRHSCSF